MGVSSETAKLIAQLVLDDKLTPGALRALGTVDKMERGFGRAGKGAGQLGKGLLRLGAVGAGAVAVGIAGAGKAAIDFEDAFAGIRKTVDETDLAKAGLSFDDIRKSMLNLSTTIPITASDLARLGEAAGALGVNVKDIAAFAEVTAKLGATTNLTADEAAQSLGKIGTILGLTGKGYETFADALVNLGNKGASTEAEIIETTKRFAAAGKAAGLSTAQILGFSSAIASAGVEPEAAGSSLSRLFGNLVKETALATDKAKAFAKVSGKSFKDFAGIVENDTNGAMLLFLKNLGKLDKFDQAKALKAVGITSVRDINAIRLLAQTYDKNLIPALRNAADSAGALDEESTKKFDTIKQKWQLLKNAFTKGGIEMGEGFLPALGRLTTKVTAWVNTNSGKLQQVGRDIGKALDDIDWKEVERGAGRVADAARVILDVVKQIPTEVKLGGLAFIGLDKASGGLLGKGLGNIAGGAGNVLMDRFFARGSSPANALWVQSIGGVGGPGGAAAGAAGWAASLKPFLALLGPSIAAAVGSDFATTETNKGLGSNFLAPGSGGIGGGIITALHNLGEVIKLWKPGEVKPADREHEGSGARRPSPTHTPTSSEARAGMPEVRQWHFDKDTRVTTAVENMRADLGPSLSQTIPVKLDRVATNTIAAGLATKNAESQTKAATDRVAAVTRASGITSAVAARLAGDKAYRGGALSASAIRHKRLSVTTHVNVRTSINAREWLAQATQTNIRGGAS